MKKSIILFLILGTLIACGGSSNNNKSEPQKMANTKSNNNGKGVGEIKSVALNDPLNQEMIGNGESIYNMKCAACHKLGSNRVVGPGFKGVTERRKPEWIMNMITNTEAMLDEDPEARKLFEECLTRMPNQNVAQEDARDILEFLLKNDQ